MKAMRMCAVLTLMLASAGFGTVIYVDASAGNDAWPGTAGQPKRSIGAAITAAVDLDTVMVRAGTYTGASNRNLRPGAKNIVIRSESGAGVTIIDAEGLDRVFMSQLSPATAKIKGFTIQNGYNSTTISYGGGGGGLCLIQTEITVEDCVIRDCISPEGAGMIVRNSQGPRIINCDFINNKCEHATMACRAGAVSIYMSSDVEFTGCRFISNRVQPSNTGHGGVLYVWREGAAFKNCIFEGNYAKGAGGVAYIEEGRLTFDQCTFYGNSSGASGGCFFIVYMGVAHEAVCTNSLFYGNSAGGSGSVVYLTGVGTAGGIFRYGYCAINPSGIVRGGTGGTVVENMGGNINVNPLVAQAGYCQAGTGLWIPGDYHLQSMVGRFNPITGGWLVDTAHSPCIDAGNPALDASPEPAPNGGRINMGAYGGTKQASKSVYCEAPIAADLTGDCRVDIEDFAELAAAWMTCNIVPAVFCW